MTTTRATKHREGTGFTLVELLTVLAIVAVMATLLFSAVSGARTRSNQVVCRNNLRQAALAVEMYQDDTGRRPRSFTRMANKPSIIRNPKVFVCPADPALRAGGDGVSGSNTFWGNRVNASQEPVGGRSGVPEEGSWEQEIRETAESIPFSYLHPLAWRREAWSRLMQGRGNQIGVAACQLHGLRSPVPGRRPFTEYEGQTLRAQRDGAVIPRKIFRTMAAPPGTTPHGMPTRAMTDPVEGTLTVLMSDDEYAWEFYTDVVPSSR